MLKIPSLTALGLVAASPLFAGISCSDLDSYAMPTIGSYVDVLLKSGEAVTVTAGSGSSAYITEGGGSVQKCGFIYGSSSCADHVFEISVDDSYTIEKTGGTISDSLTCAAGSTSSEKSDEEAKAPAGFRPSRYTNAPDLIPSNIGTCDGQFVSGFQILGAGRIQRFVEARYADSCFNFDVTFLPEGVRALDINTILAFLGTSDFDIFTR